MYDSGWQLLNQSSTLVDMCMLQDGYRDGIEEGKREAVQDGFDAGNGLLHQVAPRTITQSLLTRHDVILHF